MVDKNGTMFVFIMVLPKNIHHFSEDKRDINFFFEKSFAIFFLIAPIGNISLLNESFFCCRFARKSLCSKEACNFKRLQSFVTTHVLLLKLVGSVPLLFFNNCELSFLSSKCLCFETICDHWLLSDALCVAITMCLKWREEVTIPPTQNNLINSFKVVHELVLFAFNIKNEVCGVLTSFLSLWRKYKERKTHNVKT